MHRFGFSFPWHSSSRPSQHEKRWSHPWSVSEHRSWVVSLLTRTPQWYVYIARFACTPPHFHSHLIFIACILNLCCKACLNCKISWRKLCSDHHIGININQVILWLGWTLWTVYSGLNLAWTAFLRIWPLLLRTVPRPQIPIKIEKFIRLPCWC